MRITVPIFAAVAYVVCTLASAVDVPVATGACQAVQPAPSGCGIVGELGYKYQNRFGIASPQIVSGGLEECASYCEGRVKSKDYYQSIPYSGQIYESYAPYCTSFSYTTNTSLCRLGRLDVRSVVKPDAKSNTVFYNSGCFDCGGFCNQPFGDQLVENGDFEGSLLGPWTALDSTLGVGHKSSQAYLCTEKHAETCLLSQEINMCNKELYVFQFDYLTVYTNKSLSVPSIQATFGGRRYSYSPPNPPEGNFVYLAYSANTNKTAWKTVRGYFRYFDSLHFGPTFEFLGGGSFSLDNIYVSHVPNPKLVSGAESILQNGGFETGSLSSWTQGNFGGRPTVGATFKVVSPGITGNYAVSFNITQKSLTGTTKFLTQRVTTKPNKAYLVSFDMKIFNATFDVYLYTGSNKISSSHVRHWGPGMHHLSVPVVADSKSMFVKFQMILPASRRTGSMVLDNFKMIEVAESKYFP